MKRLFASTDEFVRESAWKEERPGRPEILPTVFRAAGRGADRGTLRKGCEDCHLVVIDLSIHPIDGYIVWK